MARDVSLAQTILGVLTVFLGGGMVQFMLHMSRRRNEFRTADRTSGAELLTAATADAEQLRQWIANREIRISTLETRLEEDRTQARAELERAHRENERLSQQVAQLETDLDISRGQIAQLRRQLPDGS
jgi:septal ring factor EnvC (AmiA/AmiB activator)